MLPHGKDLNDFHRDGGDVLGWLAGEFDRLGWHGPSEVGTMRRRGATYET